MRPPPQPAEMGRLEDAQKHWETFTQPFTHPDAELRPLIDEARSAVTRATETTS